MADKKYQCSCGIKIPIKYKNCSSCGGELPDIGPESDNALVEMASRARIANVVKLGAEIAKEWQTHETLQVTLNDLYQWLTNQKPAEGIWQEAERRLSTGKK